MKNYKLAHLITNLRRKREDQGLTQARVAKILELPQSYISELETGERDPRLSTFIEWARALGFELSLIPTELVLAVNQIVGNIEKLDPDDSDLSPFKPLPEDI